MAKETTATVEEIAVDTEDTAVVTGQTEHGTTQSDLVKII